MDYRKIGEQSGSLYDSRYSETYRKMDVFDAETDFHRHIIEKLRSTCRGFDRPVAVLDVGCGTGRHFYGLSNVEKLIGIDVSVDMLREARNPINVGMLDIREMVLLQGNAFEYPFEAESFDFIYSIGVLGEHSPFDDVICKRIYELLRPGGKAFVTVVDASSKWQRKLAEIFYPVLPSVIKKKLHYRRRSFYLSFSELKDILNRSSFRGHFRITRSVYDGKQWTGAHFECEMGKITG